MLAACQLLKSMFRSWLQCEVFAFLVLEGFGKEVGKWNIKKIMQTSL